MIVVSVIFYFVSNFFFIFNHFDWIFCNRTQGVCLCVCKCVSSLQPKRMNRFWWNFPKIIWQIFASVILRCFTKFEFDDVMAAILFCFCVAALSRSQFKSDFLQIWTQGILVYADVCYENKNAKMLILHSVILLLPYWLCAPLEEWHLQGSFPWCRF